MIWRYERIKGVRTLKGRIGQLRFIVRGHGTSATLTTVGVSGFEGRYTCADTDKAKDRANMMAAQYVASLMEEIVEKPSAAGAIWTAPRPWWKFWSRT